MDENILISFLLCTLNREEDFKRSINSLNANKIGEVPFEIIVVDQGNSKKISKLCKSVGAIYIQTSTLGLSLARNIGIKKCKGEYIALMDDDAFISKDYYKNFDSIIKNINSEPFDVLSGRIMTIEDNLIPLSRYQGSSKKDISFKNIDTIMSSALVINRKILNIVGGFDESFGVGAMWGGSEETDIIARILREGYQVKYIPSLVVYHPSANFGLMSLNDIFQKTYTYGLGRGAFLRKNRFLPKYLILRNLLVPILAAFVSLILLRPKQAFRYISSFLGRFFGYVTYSRNYN